MERRREREEGESTLPKTQRAIERERERERGGESWLPNRQRAQYTRTFFG
jgi:hypothetical protein